VCLERSCAGGPWLPDAATPTTASTRLTDLAIAMDAQQYCVYFRAVGSTMLPITSGYVVIQKVAAARLRIFSRMCQTAILKNRETC
jgi:hypothetical protein